MAKFTLEEIQMIKKKIGMKAEEIKLDLGNGEMITILVSPKRKFVRVLVFEEDSGETLGSEMVRWRKEG